jgi:hypothetical protein
MTIYAITAAAALITVVSARGGRLSADVQSKRGRAAEQTSTFPAGSQPESLIPLKPADLLFRIEPRPEANGGLSGAVGSDGHSAVAVKPPGPPDQPGECRSTPLSPVALASALYEGYIAQFGEPPRIERLACAWAQCALENARGAILYENNLGNVTTPDGQRSCVKRINERVSRSPERWDIRTMRFRAFDSPIEGATAYWRLLARSYSSVLARCDAADPRGAAVRLSELGYFTGASEPYVAAMGSLFAYANRRLRGPNFLAPGSL